MGGKKAQNLKKVFVYVVHGLFLVFGMRVRLEMLRFRRGELLRWRNRSKLTLKQLCTISIARMDLANRENPL